MNRRRFMELIGAASAAFMGWNFWKRGRVMPLTRRTLFTDDFNRSTPHDPLPAVPPAPNNTWSAPPGDCSLGPNWNYDFSSGWGARDWSIWNGAMFSHYNSSIDEAFYVGVMPNDQWAQIEFLRIGDSAGSNHVVAVWARMGASTTTGYGFWIYGDTGEWFIVTGNFTTTLATGTTSPLADNSVVRIEVQGTEIRGYVNDVLIGSVTDSTFTGGKVGFGFNGTYVSGGYATVVDNFAAGDWESAGTDDEPIIFVTT